jgi:hypothetical protein
MAAVAIEEIEGLAHPGVQAAVYVLCNLAHDVLAAQHPIQL